MVNFSLYSRSLYNSTKLLHIPLRNYSNTTTNLVDITVNANTGFATVSMNKPPVNSLNLELIQALSKAMSDLEKNKCRGMILTSSMPTIFSAGLDIQEMYKPEENRVKEFWTSLQELWIQLYGSFYPTVAAITGHSPAGGCLLSLSCEYRVMVKNFTIGLNETKLGIVAPTWFSTCMRNVVGNRVAEISLTTGHMYDTDEALKIGLIDEKATNKEEALIKAETFLKRFNKISPSARAITKQLLRRADIEALSNNQEDDLEMFYSVISSPAVQKGLGLYLESLKK